MMYLHTAQQIRDAEWPLLNVQVETDELMRQAASRVADVARVMLAKDRPFVAESDDVLLLVGPGGNGGDALYAGAELLGVRNVHAVLVAGLGDDVENDAPVSSPHSTSGDGSDCDTEFTAAGAELVDEEPEAPMDDVPRAQSNEEVDHASDEATSQEGDVSGGAEKSPAHEPALQAFKEAGGVVLREVPLPHDYRLIIDGISGLGGGRALDEGIAELVADATGSGIPILSIDIPSGVAADTGAVPDAVVVNARGFDALDKQWSVQRVPAHVKATVTVTFGGLRVAHGVAKHLCGQVVLVDLNLPRPVRSLGEELLAQQTGAENAENSASIRFIQLPSSQAELFDFSDIPDVRPDPLEWSTRHAGVLDDVFAGEPQPDAHKYSGGVVTVCAGSDQYPGAGQLCALSAMKATSFGVRFVGDAISTSNLPPEILRVTDLVHNYRSHAYAVGPGRGLEQRTAMELGAVLSTADPVVIDADAISVLAQDDDLKTQVHNRDGLTVITPHEGEFVRLVQRSGDASDVMHNRVEATANLARELNCFILLKGRASVIASPRGTVTVVEAGSSWAATPGSGDVLTGIMGAYVARVPGIVADIKDYFPELEDVRQVQEMQFMENIVAAVIVHSTAARLGAQTEFGAAPISASVIAETISTATAYLRNEGRA